MYRRPLLAVLVLLTACAPPLWAGTVESLKLKGRQRVLQVDSDTGFDPVVSTWMPCAKPFARLSRK